MLKLVILFLPTTSARPMNDDSILSASFSNRLHTAIESNLENEHFGVEELAKELGVSRTQLHRKLQQLNGKSASQVIREYRLEKAKEILVNKDLTAAEVAYKVGFNSPSYFNTCFAEYFGFSPGVAKYHSEDEIHNKSVSKSRIIILGSGLLLIVIVLVSIWLITDLNFRNAFANKDLDLEKVTIAVLPFENLSNDPNQDFFNEGIAENIRDKLSRLSGLRVISMTSTKIYKTQIVGVKQIGKELDSDYLLEGSVFKANNQIRINVSLIECNSGSRSWSNSYEKELSDILNLQNEIALNVTRELQINITEKEYLTLQEIKDINPDIYTDFLYAGFLKKVFEEKNDSSYNNHAIELLTQIIKKEPLFTEAYVELVWNLWATRLYNRQLFESIGTDSIMNIIQTAIDLNPDYPEAYYFLSKFYYLNDNFSEVEKTLKKVIKLDPNHYESMFDLANVSLQQRNFEEAFEHLFTITRLKPINIHSSEIDLKQMLLISSYFVEMFMVQESELILKKMIELDSMSSCGLNVYKYLVYCSTEKHEHFRWALAQYKCDTTSLFAINELGKAYVMIGQYRKGIHFFDLSLKQAKIRPRDDTTWCYPHRAYAYQQLGEEEKANQILISFIEIAEKDQFDNWQWKTSNIAEAYALLGEKEKALELLKSLPYSAFRFIPLNEMLYKLKEEKEYQEIIQKAKAEEERVRNIATSPKVQREVRWLFNRLEIKYTN